MAWAEAGFLRKFIGGKWQRSQRIAVSNEELQLRGYLPRSWSYVVSMRTILATDGMPRPSTRKSINGPRGSIGAIARPGQAHSAAAIVTGSHDSGPLRLKAGAAVVHVVRVCHL